MPTLDITGSLNVNDTGFVFDNDYKLPDLKETEDFILMNKHLPDIPSAEEMKENGLELGDMQIKLLQKLRDLHFMKLS